MYNDPEVLSDSFHDLSVNRYFGLLQYVLPREPQSPHEFFSRFSIVISLVSGAWKPSTCKRKPSYLASANNNVPLDGYLWEPVGALISTVLSQSILGARVFAVSSTP